MSFQVSFLETSLIEIPCTLESIPLACRIFDVISASLAWSQAETLTKQAANVLIMWSFRAQVSQ
jgi:hypothetical protein